MKKFALTLFAILVSVATADARVAGSANPHKYYLRCAEGKVGTPCACHGASGHYQICHAGHYCHTFDGACRP